MMANSTVALLSFLLILLPASLNTGSMAELILADEAVILIRSLSKVLEYINKFYYDMNIDGALGVVLAEVQLNQTLNMSKEKQLREALRMLVQNCHVASQKIMEQLPKVDRFLLHSSFWRTSPSFMSEQLDDLGIYASWTIEDIMKNRSASYGGISSDECLTEILSETADDQHLHKCSVGSRCKMLMFGDRIDTGYVLTHRLLYLKIFKAVGCTENKKVAAELAKKYCSLILKEAKTNANLGFPQHDIFLEQVVLCGMEGFTEFFEKDWITLIVKWQSPEGCYKAHEEGIDNDRQKLQGRSANVIAFGCTNHATGLGAAALALNLKYIVSQLQTDKFITK